MINDGTTLEHVRDHIVDDMLPKAYAQWASLKAEKPPQEAILRWVSGRIDAALQILQTIDQDAYNEQTSRREESR
ncbi:hypothetical protein [Nocardia sp. XZ_19_385]|uniref:hypothetical protein n=1 Tax=Nocardia sp. XZ_19_385 TaxID=2769488 RepID=UPI00188DD4C1|nr:hypothetical protein [Nocardia sp. XZ_19_385]